MSNQSAHIKELLEKNNGIKLDIGCGANKMQGFVGMDYRPLPGVDIVQNVLQFPWPLPDESVSTALTSHLLEHLNPMPPSPQVTALVDLLISKKILTEEEVKSTVGEHDPGPLFMRFMDEVWRIMKPDGEFASVFPYAGSYGFHQDPTHINNINEMTWEYFDPLSPRSNGVLWGIYKPKPWKIKSCNYAVNGNMEVVLIKRRLDKSYGIQDQRSDDDKGSQPKPNSKKT